MDTNQHQSANHIIEFLNDIQVDGETIEYIVDNTGMREQLLRQLFLKANDTEVKHLIEERINHQVYLSTPNTQNNTK